MIFVTVGAQMPFPRLVDAVDRWAAGRPGADVFAQIGRAAPPASIAWTPQLDTDAFRACMYHASAVVTHAGMGTILAALELGRPIVVMPRRAHLGETRNDHQMDTCEQLRAERPEIRIAWTEDELPAHLDAVDRVVPAAPVASHASIELLEAIRDFIRHDEPVERPAEGPVEGPVEGPAGRIGPDAGDSGRKAA